MKKILFIFLIISLSIKAQTNKVIDKLIENICEENQIPAISASLVASNKIYYGVGGTTKINGNEKVGLKSKFHLGSNTKAITSFIAMKMVEKEEIKLSTKFIDLFPDLKPKIKKEYYSFNLENFLSHNAMIQPYTKGTDYLKLPKFPGSISDKRLEFSKIVLNDVPVKLGTYSNAGYVVATSMLEKASGMSFEKLIKKYFSELDIEYYIGFPNKESEKNPSGHWKENGKWISHLPNHTYKLKDYMLPAGDISMNIENYSKFIQLHLKGLEANNFLTQKSYNKIHFGLKGYSLGWMNTIVNAKKISTHDGSAGTYYCHTILVPKLNIAIIVMSNTGENKGVYQLRELIFKNIKKIQSEK